ncbi:MAG: insulinase family protein [Coriobacteriia bacterium]|nr:insulinase family protein [Coriobacteriia bacterium]
MKYNFKEVKQKTIPEIKGEAIEMLHTSGAKLLYIKNDDNEKAFSISFKTPPKDSTGVFHILEHSVLCGSKKFPVKEPFTNLLKTSMQTFLNAITFADKTMYPVASTNETDLMNLVDVYMDAVFNPKLHDDINIFYQEGGHKTPDGGFNGVVFNEMSGAYSDPNEMLEEYLMQNLYPNTHYKYSSGGAPKDIKKLTYTDFKQEHYDHYQPSNAYIVVYGNLNIERMLKFLDKEYLSKWNNKQANKPREIETQTPLVSDFKQYEMKTSKENACAGCAYVVEREHFKNFAVHILLDALTSTNESPLKAKLLKSGIASDYDFCFYNGINQPAIYVTAKSIKPGKAKQLDKIIKDSIKSIKLDRQTLAASISRIEFTLKEQIPEMSPGIDMAINSLGEWLYDEDASMDALFYYDDIERAKKLCTTDYFIELANEIFVNNNHYAQAEIVPTEKEQKEKLVPDDSVIELCKTLEEKQNTPDSIEDINKLPKMKISDIEEINKWPPALQNNNIRRYKVDNTDISYVNRYYDMQCLKVEELPYAAVISLILGKLDTTNFNAQTINQLEKTYLGNLNFATSVFNGDEVKVKFTIRSSSLAQNTHKLASLVDEIIFNTKYDNIEKIKAILIQQKVIMEQNFINAGHIASLSRAMSYINPASKVYDMMTGVDFYKFLKTDIDYTKLKSIAAKIFSQKPDISIIANDNAYDTYLQIANIKNEKHNNKLTIPKCEDKNEAFLIPSDVSYNSIVGKLCNDYTGPYNVASKVISLDYLWNEVRVKNGAYGSGVIISTKSNIQYYSFRDPHQNQTYKTYQKAGEWLDKHNFTKEELEGYIISSVAKIDAPKPIKEIMNLQDNNYYSNVSPDFREINRNQIINTTAGDINKCAKDIDVTTKNGVKCTFSNKVPKGMNEVNLFC